MYTNTYCFCHQKKKSRPLVPKNSWLSLIITLWTIWRSSYGGLQELAVAVFFVTRSSTAIAILEIWSFCSVMPAALEGCVQGNTLGTGIVIRNWLMLSLNNKKRKKHFWSAFRYADVFEWIGTGEQKKTTFNSKNHISIPILACTRR